MEQVFLLIDYMYRKQTQAIQDLSSFKAIYNKLVLLIVNLDHRVIHYYTQFQVKTGKMPHEFSQL